MPKTPTKGARGTGSPILGRWRITDMELWAREARDLVVPAFIEFRPDGLGQFQFVAVQGQIDYRLLEQDGKPAVEWSWQGLDEMDPCCGRGWAVLECSGKLEGRIFSHRGDDSALTAEKQ